jgi:hypothetical protein
VYIHSSIWIFICLSVSFTFSFSVSFSLSHSPLSHSLFLSPSLYLYLPFSLYLYISPSPSLSLLFLSLTDKGLWRLSLESALNFAKFWHWLSKFDTQPCLSINFEFPVPRNMTLLRCTWVAMPSS